MNHTPGCCCSYYRCTRIAALHQLLLPESLLAANSRPLDADERVVREDGAADISIYNKLAEVVLAWLRWGDIQSGLMLHADCITLFPHIVLL